MSLWLGQWTHTYTECILTPATGGALVPSSKQFAKTFRHNVSVKSFRRSNFGANFRRQGFGRNDAVWTFPFSIICSELADSMYRLEWEFTNKVASLATAQCKCLYWQYPGHRKKYNTAVDCWNIFLRYCIENGRIC